MQRRFLAPMLVGVSLFALFGTPARGQGDAFPFPIPFDTAPDNSAADVSFLNGGPLTANSRLVVKEGRFFTKAGKRVRFVGVSIAAPSCFPPKSDAPMIAARLAKLGVNCVRLHHMDAPWPVPNLFYFDSNAYGKPTLKLDPRTLERLDFFVSQLKKRGIYCDLNLHVSRIWSKENGFPQDGKLPDLGKVVAYFDPKAIELQKQFAIQMLSRKNAYTGVRYADDPVIAVVEMNNEDSLVGHGGDGLPPSYRNQIKTQWNRYLRAKYKTTAALQKAWNAAAEPMGANLLKNPRLESGVDGWTAETHDATLMNLSAESAAGQTNAPEGRVMKVSGIKTDGTNWHLQLHQTGLNLLPGKKYTFSFVAKAAAPRSLGLTSRLDQAPWSFVGLDANIGLSPQWKRYTYTFTTNNNVVANHSRITWVVGDSDTEFWVGDISLRPGGGGSALSAGESLEAANIEIPGVNDSAAGRDYTECLSLMEQRYTDAIKGAVRSTGCPALLTCSQASYGGAAGVLRESRLDYVDMHSYWQHPGFPGNAFDPNNYRIENTPMVAALRGGSLGTLDGLAMHRVAGKPFTVSEYDHPAPSEYAAEMTPLIFAYAARQDWDGVFLFAYETDKGNAIGGWFDAGRHPAKMASLPWAAMAFRRGDIPALLQRMTLTASPSVLLDLKAKGTDYAFWSAVDPKITPKDFLTKRAAISVSDTATPKVVAFGPLMMERHDAFEWNAENRQVTVDVPKSQAIVGFIAAPVALSNGLSFRPGPTIMVTPLPRPEVTFAAITLTSRDDKPVMQSGRLLLSAVRWANNPGLEWNAERTFAQNSWKSGPPVATCPIGDIAIRTTLSAATVYALDGRGKRIATIPATLKGGVLTFPIGEKARTVWFEVAGK